MSKSAEARYYPTPSLLLNSKHKMVDWHLGESKVKMRLTKHLETIAAKPQEVRQAPDFMATNRNPSVGMSFRDTPWPQVLKSFEGVESPPAVLSNMSLVKVG